MKIYALFVALIMMGIVVLYVFVGKLGGGEQYLSDKLLGLNLQSLEALKSDRADLALKYQNKALKSFGDKDLPDLKAHWLSQRGRAHLMMGQLQAAEADYQQAMKLPVKQSKTVTQLSILRADLLPTTGRELELKDILSAISAEEISPLDTIWQRDYYLLMGSQMRTEKACQGAMEYFKKACGLGVQAACSESCP